MLHLCSTLSLLRLPSSLPGDRRCSPTCRRSLFPPPTAAHQTTRSIRALRTTLILACYTPPLLCMCGTIPPYVLTMHIAHFPPSFSSCMSLPSPLLPPCTLYLMVFLDARPSSALLCPARCQSLPLYPTSQCATMCHSTHAKANRRYVKNIKGCNLTSQTVGRGHPVPAQAAVLLVPMSLLGPFGLRESNQIAAWPEVLPSLP